MAWRLLGGSFETIGNGASGQSSETQWLWVGVAHHSSCTYSLEFKPDPSDEEAEILPTWELNFNLMGIAENCAWNNVIPEDYCLLGYLTPCSPLKVIPICGGRYRLLLQGPNSRANTSVKANGYPKYNSLILNSLITISIYYFYFKDFNLTQFSVFYLHIILNCACCWLVLHYIIMYLVVYACIYSLLFNISRNFIL